MTETWKAAEALSKDVRTNFDLFAYFSEDCVSEMNYIMAEDTKLSLSSRSTLSGKDSGLECAKECQKRPVSAFPFSSRYEETNFNYI